MFFFNFGIAPFSLVIANPTCLQSKYAMKWELLIMKSSLFVCTFLVIMQVDLLHHHYSESFMVCPITTPLHLSFFSILDCNDVG